MASRSLRTNKGNGANVGFEDKLWAAADRLRSNMDAAEYKHVVLGLIFLKYVSDASEEKHQALLAEVDNGADPEDPAPEMIRCIMTDDSERDFYHSWQSMIK